MTLSDVESKNIDYEELNSLLMKTIDELESRFNDGKNEDIDVKARLLVAICAKLWKEKDGWKQMYYELYDRYNKHLDKEMETLRKMLPRTRL